MFPFFFFNDTATTEIYTLSLHDALPIWARPLSRTGDACGSGAKSRECSVGRHSSISFCRSGPTRCSCPDRKSTRLNSSHANISYAVFCLKKKKKYKQYQIHSHIRQRHLL